MQTTDREFTLYIRRCHICDTLNEDACEAQKYGPGGSDPAIKCGRCGKYLAPFVFCYPTALKSADDSDLNPALDLVAEQRKKPIYPPLIGLAIYW